MRSASYLRYGGPMTVETVAEPVAAAGELLIEVRAAGVNSWDWDKYSGHVFARVENPVVPKHRILGGEVAGIVRAVGAGVTAFRPGDAVLGDTATFNWGGFAEVCVGRADRFIVKPDALSFEDAACVPQAGLLALQGLAGIAPGMQVLINGAGGGMGAFAIQLAARQGAEVTAVDSAQKAEAMRALGASRTIDYRQTDFATLPDRYDLVLDAVARRPIGRHFDVLKPGGRYIVVGGRVPALLQTALFGASRVKRDGRRVSLLIWEPRTHDMTDLAERVARGEIRVPIERRHGLHDAHAALDVIGNGSIVGKRVVMPNP